MDKAICAITLSTGKPMMVDAVWRKGSLFLLSATPLPATRSQLTKELPEKIAQLESSNVDVLVDERSGYFTSNAGTRVQLDSIGNSGKPILVEALDLYRELMQQKAISRPKKGGERFNIPDNIIDIDHDMRGQTLYRIDWERLQSEHILMILCVYGTVYQNVSSASYLKQMYSNLVQNKPKSPLDSLKNIVAATEADGVASVTMSPLTGKGNYL